MDEYVFFSVDRPSIFNGETIPKIFIWPQVRDGSSYVVGEVEWKV